jgi:hypothetical protein
MTSFRRLTATATLTLTLALLLLTSTKVNGHARGSTTVVPSLGAEIQAPRQLMEDAIGGTANNGGGDGGLVESRDCQSFDTLDPGIKSNENTVAACLTNSCGGGCCRIFLWMVCDEDNEYPHLACICNENTATKAPAANPTPSPTSSPTVTPLPTTAPTLPPTDLPTKEPSPSPTQGPTRTISPTASPTATPSEAPITPPTQTPSVMPTAPTYITEDTINESGVAVRSSMCLLPPSEPKLQFIETATYYYDYEVYTTTDSVIETTTIFLNNQIHDAVAAKFLRCLFQGGNDLWIIHSEPHVVDTASSCGTSPPAGEQCFVVAAQDKVWIYADPGSTRRRRNLETVDFVFFVTSFIKDSMAAGVFNSGGPATGISQIVYGSPRLNSIGANSPTPDPSEAPITNSGGEPGERNGVIGQNPGGDPQNEGPTPGIVVLIVVAAAVVLVLVLALFRREKRRSRQLEYLEKVDLDLVHQVTSLEEHVDLDSLPGDIVLSGGGGSNSGDDDGSNMDPYTTATPSRRSHRSPLYSQDELDQAVGGGDHHQRSGFHNNRRNGSSPSRHHNRRYRSSDTVDL